MPVIDSYKIDETITSRPPASNMQPNVLSPKDWEKIIQEVEQREVAFEDLNTGKTSQIISSLSRPNNETNFLFTNEGTGSNSQMDTENIVTKNTGKTKQVKSGNTSFHVMTTNLTFGDLDDWAAGHGPPFGIGLHRDARIPEAVRVSFIDGEEHKSLIIALRPVTIFLIKSRTDICSKLRGQSMKQVWNWRASN